MSGASESAIQAVINSTSFQEAVTDMINVRRVNRFTSFKRSYQYSNGQKKDDRSSFIYPFSLSFLSVSYLFAIPSFSYPVFKCFSLVIIFLFLRWGQVPILRSIQYITYKYGDFQKASRTSLFETSTINSIVGYLLPNPIGSSSVQWQADPRDPLLFTNQLS